MQKKILKPELHFNVLEEDKVSQRESSLLSLELQGVADDLPWRTWYSSKVRANHIGLGEPSSKQVHKKFGPKHLYLFANGSDEDLAQIKPGNGIPVEEVQYDFSVVFNSVDNVVVVVGCICYDQFGNKIDMSQSNDMHLVVSPVADCAFILPYVKVSGQGALDSLVFKVKTAQRVITSSELSSISADAMVSVPLKQLLKLEESNNKRFDIRRREQLLNEREMELNSQRAGAIIDEKMQVAINASNQLSLSMITELSKSISTSNGSKLCEPHPYKVGIITDTYMFNYYKDAFETVVALSPDHFEQQFEEHGFDIIIYVSCWKGTVDNEWQGIHYREKPKAALDGIVKLARDRGAKLLFQSIEDPSNFEHFLPIAKQFDYVLTSDSDMITSYKDACGHENVFYGEYGVNPLFNNPIDSRKFNFNAPFFAGSYTTRYEERCVDMRTMFDSLIDSGVAPFVCDRNLHLDNESYKFPENIQPFIHGPLEHDVLQKVHKMFRYNVNFNSIKSSPTMCAMRVYELQAQCTSILSNYAKSVFNKFPNIRLVPTRQNLMYDFSSDRLVDEYRGSVAAARRVISQKSAPKLTGELLSYLGLQASSSTKTIAVLCLDNDVAKQFSEQSYLDFKVYHLAEIQNLSTFCSDERIDFFVCVSNENSYGKFFLEDLVNGFAYTSSSYVTKPIRNGNETDDEIYSLGHSFVDRIGRVEATLFDAQDVPLEWVIENIGTADIELSNGYQVDPFEFNDFVALEALKESQPLKYSIIVPTFNNGNFVTTKCIPSLMRNRTWNEMEVILVDDGSTDSQTIDIVKSLVERYPNVRGFYFNDGGSGSASRPRNKGVELASTGLIGFLDPDNEISPEGYDHLFELITHAKEPLDFVAGYHMKVTNTSAPIGQHSDQALKIINDARSAFFANGKFPIVPTQPALISKTFLLKHNISFVVGAVGQDTLYGWQVLFYSNACGFTNSAHLIYYAERETSVTNEISTTFFEKSIVMESAQHRFLQREGLLNAYREHCAEKFINNWYMPKLRQCKDPDLAREMLGEIAKLYGMRLPELDGEVS